MSKKYHFNADGSLALPSDLAFDAERTFDLDAHYSGKGTAYVKHCSHRGEDPVFTDYTGRKFYGAQGHNVTPALYHVILDCAGAVPKPFLLGASTRFRHLVMPQHFLRLHWPDMGIPPVAPQWWLRLARALPKRADVIAACIGGHGRTGSALALLALATQVVDTADEAITLIRSAHCSKAIETRAQEEYIRTFAKWLDTLPPKDKRVTR